MAIIGAAAPEAALVATAGASLEDGVVPPFWESERQRLTLDGALSWSPVPTLRVSAHVAGWRRDAYPDTVVAGPGDITLGVEADAWRGLGGVWLVKQPNAEDERELGTDETDVHLMARWQHPRAAVLAGASLRGDPLRYSAQDVAPVGWLVGRHPVGALTAVGRVGGTLASPHNPARLSAALGGRVGAVGAELTVGLTEAAADWGARLWVSGRRPARTPAPG